jgi:hypothetical protein
MPQSLENCLGVGMSLVENPPLFNNFSARMTAEVV